MELGDPTGSRSLIDLDIAKSIAAESSLDQRLADLGKRQGQDPRHLVFVHVIGDRLEVGELRTARPHVGGALGSAPARGRIEDLDRLAIERQHATCRRQRGAPGDLVGGAHDLTVRRVTQVESLAPVTALVDDGVSADCHCERLLGGIGGARLGLARQDTRDVDLERNLRDSSARGEQTDVHRATCAGALEHRVADIGLRARRRAAHRRSHDERSDHPRRHSFRSHPGRHLHWITCSPSVW